jgi:hypothetical protein
MENPMEKEPKDPEREERIESEIIVDAYNGEEQAMSWYYYLQDKIQFPVNATCINERKISPLRTGDKVKVLEMAPEEECRHEMFVVTEWEKRAFAVPLSQLMPASRNDEESLEAIEDWHYWTKRGYTF